MILLDPPQLKSALIDTPYWGLNLQPPACEESVLPLSYIFSLMDTITVLYAAAG